jgi:large subunit ribosomal protein L9
MKVLLRRNVSKLGKIGEVVEVKPGYARNYLLPHRLAVQPTKNNLKAVEAEKQKYLEELAKQKSQLEAKAAVVNGKEITLPARANAEGHLYGSIGPAQIVSALAKENIFVEEENVLMDSPIRKLDKYDIKIEWMEEVSATVHVWVVAIHEEGDEAEAEAEAAGEESAEEKTEERGEESSPADEG